MPDRKNDDLAVLVRQWLDKAQADLELARFLWDGGTRFLDAIGFNCHQASEKYLKAYLTFRQVSFPKTHDLAALLELAAKADEKLAQGLQDLPKMNTYGVEIRYPGDIPKLSASEAEAALHLAGKAQHKVMAAFGPRFQVNKNQGSSGVQESPAIYKVQKRGIKKRKGK